ncbi:Golgi apparatus protein 1 [Condylostylus longicornis]|uniref:Golgi apparatus protein 1 n=1 Tax=Condylostylus longicornis TaxID=2530218 RepID=UPI00244DCA65|nr:Golgi apparatus protein 1 [Condylostylus longicornis]
MNSMFCLILLYLTSTKFHTAGDPIINSTDTIIIKRSPILDNLLIENPDCQDLKSVCSFLKFQDDLSILVDCIQTMPSSKVEYLDDKCQHVIFEATRNILKDSQVKKITDKPCSRHKDKFNDCQPKGNQIGYYLSCLVEKVDNFNDISICRDIIQKLESIAFTDYRLVTNFIKDCGTEISNHKCGRISLEEGKVSQGETIACMQEKINELSSDCQKRILKLSELQASNFKLDHQFFISCEKDYQRFCPNDRPGSGEILKCLIKQKNNPELSVKCREQVMRRDKLLAHDYRLSKGLAKKCKDDIKNNHCRRNVSEDKSIRLAQILLCLESVIKNGTKVAEECRSEIDDHRRMLMMDYQLSPEILSGCSDDIPKFCGEIEVQNSAGGEIIHCLMEHARSKRKRDRHVSFTCMRAIEDLIKVSDVGEDWRVDPVLRRNCKSVVDIACRDTDGGDARVMSCLMNNIGSQVMTNNCEQSLLLIQYFVARDFKLDPQLYRLCRDDAIKYCHAKKDWDGDGEGGQMDPERGPLVLPCLHRIAYSEVTGEQLRPICLQQVRRVMRQRAISVELIPEVEDKCLDDLAALCSDKTKKGEEMQCLQDNLEKLQPECRKAVTKYTEEEAGHIELNPIIMNVCQEAMKNHCDHILKKGNEQGDMMECLISHKNDPDLRQDLKCRAAIEHFQIISLKNYHFTYKFKQACQPHVIRFCSSSTTKYEVVACLSEVMRNDTIRGQRHIIPKECRQQVKAQLYQQRENLIFDPKLKSACRREILEYCLDAQGPGQALECLQINTPHLGSSCRHTLFSIKKSELDDSSTDYVLVNTCKEMTYKYCQNSDLAKLLDCLKNFKDEPNFDQRCHLVIVNRMIEQNTDFRFNPTLQNACGKNIDQFCSHIVSEAKPNEELNGKVINCLKQKFREAKLERQCQQKMIEILQEQALNYKLNPLLQNFCKSEIKVLCKINSNDNDEQGEVEECLKNAFLQQKIINQDCRIEVANLISESKADIHVDPLLHRACTVDLLKYCSNVKSGDGRQLKCLQIILQDESKAMEEDCRNKLRKRMEMFRNAENTLQMPPENMEQLMNQVVTSPAKKFFLVVLLSFVGMIFILGMFMGRITKKAYISKSK